MTSSDNAWCEPATIDHDGTFVGECTDILTAKASAHGAFECERVCTAVHRAASCRCMTCASHSLSALTQRRVPLLCRLASAISVPRDRCTLGDLCMLTGVHAESAENNTCCVAAFVWIATWSHKRAFHV